MSKSYTPFIPAGLRHHLPTMAREGRASVYLAILSRIDPETGDCFPSLPTIAKDAGVSEPTAKRAKRWLVDAGLLVLVKTDGRSNRYRCRSLHADGRIEGGPDKSDLDADPGNGVTRVIDLPGSQSYPGQSDTRVRALPATRVTVLPDIRVTPLPAKEQQIREQQKGTPEAAADAAPIVAVEMADISPTATPVPTGEVSKQDVTILLPAISAAPNDEVDWSEFDDGEDAEEDDANGGDFDDCPPPDEAEPVMTASVLPAPSAITTTGPRRKLKRVRRTTEREELVRLSFEHLVCWLGYGIAAVGTPMQEWSTLEPANGNWFDDGTRFSDPNELPSPALDDIRLASWAWYELNRARVDAGLGVLLYEGSLLGKDGKSKTIGSLISTRGKAETIRIVRCMSEHYLALCEAVKARWPAFLPPALDERYFSHPELIKVAERMLSAPPQLPGTYNLAI